MSTIQTQQWQYSICRTGQQNELNNENIQMNTISFDIHLLSIDWKPHKVVFDI